MRQKVDKGAKWCLSSEQVGWTESLLVCHIKIASVIGMINVDWGIAPR